MKIIINTHKELSFNMAAEIYFMDHFDEDVFMLWQAKPSILIGKNQNTYQEINMDYVKEHKIDVVRRKSGGGTVFCDLGNTNFAFITSDTKAFSDFSRFTRPILKVLQTLGVPAEFSGRNDLSIQGKKFSGNAQYKHKNRLLHHGTLLFQADLSSLSKAINPHKLKLQSKGIASARSRVTNIGEHLKAPLSLSEFCQMINTHILETTPGAYYYHLSPEDIRQIEDIQKTTFDNWSWTYGKSPKCKGHHSQQFAHGIVSLDFDIHKGRLTHCKFSGDFFSKRDVQDLESLLVNKTYSREAINQALKDIQIEDYFTGISHEEICNLFFQGDSYAEKTPMVKS